MSAPEPVVAHLIVGGRPEVYLAATLESVAGICDYAVINDTSGERNGVNLAAIEDSRFAREGRLSLVHTTFADFGSARNVCIENTPEQFKRGWGFRVDADEVHGDDLLTLRSVLPRLDPHIEAVDGYERHFVGSFAWWFEFSRTMMLFRLDHGRCWHGKVHERVAPIETRVALPIVRFHYGNVVLPREEALRGRLYASLGQLDEAPTDRQLRNASPDRVWPGLLRRAIRYEGQHPAAMRETIERLTAERAAIFAQVDSLAAKQSALQRFRNASRRFNANRLLLWRSAEARMRWGWRGNGRG